MESLIKKTLTRLLLLLELSDANIVAILLFLQEEEQRYQMMMWLRRMMGEDLDQKLTFQEIWLQAEKIRELYHA